MVERGNRARFLVEAIGVGSPESLDGDVRTSRVSRAFHTALIPPAPVAEREFRMGSQVGTGLQVLRMTVELESPQKIEDFRLDGIGDHR